MLHLKERRQTVTFSGIASRPVVSLNRSFSAPINLHFEQAPADLAQIARHDSDLFSRWQALNDLALPNLVEAARKARAGEPVETNAVLADTLIAIAGDEALERDFSRFLDDFDAAITPPAAGEAPSPETTGDPSFCTIWTLLGVPAVTIPTGLGSHGLPMGLQIVGNQGESNHLLATAMWCERQLPFRNLLARETELL